METLTQLFGSEVKVKLLRLFLFNMDVPFFIKEITTRSKSPLSKVRKELAVLVKADILKKKEISKDMTIKKGRLNIVKKVKGPGYILNEKFSYLEPLKNLLTVASLRADESLLKRFNGTGKIKLFAVAGVFIQSWDSRVDVLIVGDELNMNKIEATMKNIEAEIGKEIAYSAFETQEFEYRMGIHDRLVRDIMDYPRITLLDRLGMSQ